MQVLEKKGVFLGLHKKSDISFIVNNDIELLEKLKISEKNYEKNGIFYSVTECYDEHTNLINNY